MSRKPTYTPSIQAPLTFTAGAASKEFDDPAPWAEAQNVARIMLDAVPHTAKPNVDEVASISRRIERVEAVDEISIEHLAYCLSLGMTVCPCVCEGGRRKENWKSQRLWFIDIDNDEALLARGRRPLGELEAVARAQENSLPLCISYQTFSGSDMDAPPNKQRFRLVFVKEQESTDPARARCFARALLAEYPEADPSTVQPARLFYGTNKAVNVWA